MKKSGKYHNSGFGRDALSLWSACNVIADHRDAAAVRAVAEKLAAMWAASTAAARTDVAAAAAEFAADARTMSQGTWAGAAMLAALAASDLARRAGDLATAAQMDALAASLCP